MQIKLTAGGMALEYDGDEVFFRDEVGKFVQQFVGHAATAPKLAGGGEKISVDKGGNIGNHSTNTVAKLLNVQTGPDLIMAAVAKKIIVDGDEVADRNSITSEMRKASSYYKRTYTSNLSNYLDTLTKADSLRLVSENVYGLPAKMRDSLEPKLSE